jgi:hypothetical protein
MAKRTNTPTNSTRKTTPAKTVSTPVRNSAIPRSTSPTNRGFGNNGGGAALASGRQITHEAIAKRAYEIWKSGKGGSQYDNWLRAERELRAEMR